MKFAHKLLKQFMAVLAFMLLSLVHATDTTAGKKIEPEEVWITIFIHGIINIKPHLSVSNLIRFMRDQITDSIYARAVEIMRKDPFFYQFYAMQGLGLQKIDILLTTPGHASGAFAIAYDAFNALNTLNPHQKNIFYTFGWSGLLSTQIRYQEAALFYEQLETEIIEYRKLGINPKVRVIGYSHGGHVTLNVGAYFNNLISHKCDTTSNNSKLTENHTTADNKSNPSNPGDDTALNKKWTIDELVLIGVPIISDTDFLISSPLFKKVYHFYSPGDRVQVVDCLATNRFFSHRIFNPRIGFFLPDNLTQIQLRFKRIARTNFARNGCKHHTKHYPPKLLRNADPGHTELWSFGWTAGYRQYLPFYPFPAGAYIGYIINALSQCEPFGNHVVVDIHPFENSMMIKDLTSKKRAVASFPSEQEHKDVVARITPFIPTHCSKQMYEQKAQEAQHSAHEQKKEERNQRRNTRIKNKSFSHRKSL